MKAVNGGTGATLLLAAVVACSPDDSAREPGGTGTDFCGTVTARMDSFLSGFQSPEGEAYGGSAVVGGLGELTDGINSLVHSDYVSQQHQAHVALMTVVRYDEDFEPAPWLARSWEITDSTLTFHLRDDVWWHDGQRTSAHDVAFTFRRVTDPRTGFPNPAYWALYDTSPGAVEVPDSFTVRFRVPPHGEMLDPWRVTAVMPEHLLGEVPPEELREHPFGQECPVGNGPFRFVEHRQGESWTFARNPAFPAGLGGPPRLERLVYRVFADQSTLLAELLTGGVDVYPGTSAEHAREIREAETARLLAFPFRRFTFVAWNARLSRFADPRVRRALTLGLDRREMVEGVLGGYGEVLSTSVPPFHWAHDPSLADSLAYDPERARRLLEDAGWVDRDGDGVREDPRGEPLSFTLIYNRGNQLRADVAEIAQAQLRELGVEVSPRAVEYASMIERLTDPGDRDYEAFVLGFQPDFKLDDTDLFHSEKADEPLGWSGIRDPRLDRYLDTLQTFVDRDAALPLWSEYQRLLLELQPFTFLFAPVRTTGVHDRLLNVEMDARGEWVNVEEWRLAPEALR